MAKEQQTEVMNRVLDLLSVGADSAAAEYYRVYEHELDDQIKSLIESVM